MLRAGHVPIGPHSGSHCIQLHTRMTNGCQFSSHVQMERMQRALAHKLEGIRLAREDAASRAKMGLDSDPVPPYEPPVCELRRMPNFYVRQFPRRFEKPKPKPVAPPPPAGRAAGPAAQAATHQTAAHVGQKRQPQWPASGGLSSKQPPAPKRTKPLAAPKPSKSPPAPKSSKPPPAPKPRPAPPHPQAASGTVAGSPLAAASAGTPRAHPEQAAAPTAAPTAVAASKPASAGQKRPRPEESSGDGQPDPRNAQLVPFCGMYFLPGYPQHGRAGATATSSGLVVAWDKPSLDIWRQRWAKEYPDSYARYMAEWQESVDAWLQQPSQPTKTSSINEGPVVGKSFVLKLVQAQRVRRIYTPRYVYRLHKAFAAARPGGKALDHPCISQNHHVHKDLTEDEKLEVAVAREMVRLGKTGEPGASWENELTLHAAAMAAVQQAGNLEFSSDFPEGEDKEGEESEEEQAELEQKEDEVEGDAEDSEQVAAGQLESAE